MKLSALFDNAPDIEIENLMVDSRDVLPNSIFFCIKGMIHDGHRYVNAAIKNGAVCVEDEGRGMPIGMHASGVPTIQVIFTVLHAGGKFSSEGGYKTSGGLHGVGASVVNALSEWVEVTVCQEGQMVSMRFEDGGKKVGKLEKLGKSTKTGSKIRFMPDKRIFSTIEFNAGLICERARENAFLLKILRWL